MEKEFVPYEQAIDLKELGFDIPCIKYYWTDRTVNRTYETPINHNKKDIVISAPLYQQAFRWFREKYKYIGIVLPFGDNLFDYRIYSSDKGEHLIGSTEYDTCEQAELECLKKLIEITRK